MTAMVSRYLSFTPTSLAYALSAWNPANSLCEAMGGGKQPARFAILYIEQPYFPYPRRGHSPGRIQHNPYRVIITVRPGWLNLRRA